MLNRLEDEIEMLERHLEVLRIVIENEPIGIVKMSDKTGYPHHKVRYSLRLLEEDNLIEATGQGAITTDHTEEFVTELDNQFEELTTQLNMMRITETQGSER